MVGIGIQFCLSVFSWSHSFLLGPSFCLHSLPSIVLAHSRGAECDQFHISGNYVGMTCVTTVAISIFTASCLCFLLIAAVLRVKVSNILLCIDVAKLPYQSESAQRICAHGPCTN